MDLYKCDTFNLVLSDLLLTQTDRSREKQPGCDTHSCVRRHRYLLLMEAALVDKGHRLFYGSMVANHLCGVMFSAG